MGMTDDASTPPLPPVGSRGDFDYAFRRSEWAERSAALLVTQVEGLVAVAYGRSRVRPTGAEASEYQDAFQRTETHGKRPDLLVYPRSFVDRLSGRDADLIQRLERWPDADVDHLVEAAVAAIEIENSVWWGRDMPKFGKPAPRKYQGTEWDGIGFSAATGFPNVFIKMQDLDRLRRWRKRFGVPVLLGQFYLDSAYLLELARVEYAASDPDGPVHQERRSYSAREEYEIWMAPYTLGVEFGHLEEAPEITAELTRQNSGKAVGEIAITGGKWRVTDAARQLLSDLRDAER